ncbi:HMCN [Mytilus coruscus]|uniref:HMCN n=1 Tax=Mytilus coruscus TaxID=42192 RepID=A0A6J7ZVF6_MYTCO|nr:HMCN [Mytilus coruscus]
MILQCENDAIDHWENVNNRSFVVYCNELKFSSRHFLTEECNLQIRVTVDDYNTTYRCVINGNPPRVKEFKICMPTPLTSMNVVEAQSGKHVVGVEGHQMTLTCNVNSGTPRETIFWTKDGRVVSSGGPERLQYTFIPKREDNFQNYTCTANNTLKSTALRENIQLRLTLRPRLLVNMKEICIKEKMTVILSCLETLGQPIESYNWVYNDAGLIETSNELLLTSLNKSIAIYGRYTCIGKNAAGSDNATLVLHEDKLCKNNILSGQPRQFPSINLHSDGTNIYVSLKGGSVFKLKQPFFIEYRQHNSEIWRRISNHDSLKTIHQSIQISDLRPSTEYIIRLSVNGSNGYTVSEDYKMKTKENRKQANNEDVQQQEEHIDGIAADNQIYQSMSDLLAQPGASGHNGDVHSSLERSGISYTNHEVSYNLNVNTTPMENNCLIRFPKGHTFVIRGAQHRTSYAYIYFDAHSDPISSSSESRSTRTCSSVIIDEDNSDNDEDV